MSGTHRSQGKQTTRRKNHSSDRLDPQRLDAQLTKETFSAPSFVYPVTAAGLALVTVASFGLGPLGWLALATGVGAGGYAGWVAFRDQVMYKHTRLHTRMEQIKNRIEDEIDDRRMALENDLGEFADPEYSSLLDNLNNKYQLVVELMGERFEPTELTYIRYLGAAEQVYLGALDGLRVITDASRALRTTDIQALEARVVELQGRGATHDLEMISERLRIARGHMQRIADRTSQIEEAITRLSQVQEALLELNTGQGMARDPLDRAMHGLLYLIQRTDAYEKNT